MARCRPAPPAATSGCTGAVAREVSLQQGEVARVTLARIETSPGL
jgi:hypothetical protein